MKIVGPIPENILRHMPKEDRQPLGKEGMTFPEAEEKRLAVLEKKLQQQIASWLRLKEVTFNQNRMDRRTTCKVGWPDFTFAINGVPIALEVKRPGHQPTEAQKQVIAGMIRDGWKVFIVFSLCEVIRCLEPYWKH